MADTDYLAASDGTGDAALMHVTTPRTALATIIQVDTVSGVPAFFIGTWGTLLASGFIDPTTKRDFFGHVNAGTLVIDKMAPGNVDNGNTSGQVVVIKPSTPTQNLVGNFIKTALNNFGEGQLLNGKIVPTISSNNLVVSLKTLNGVDPSTTDVVYVRIGGTVRTITAPLSVTLAAGTNWFSRGLAPWATTAQDYFVYLGYNATDGVVIGVSTNMNANYYNDFTTTNTDLTYAKISTITNAAATDKYNVVNRFNAILGVSATFLWTLPAGALATITNQVIGTPNVLFGQGVWWQELGRSTLAAAAATISVTFAAKRHLRIVFQLVSASGTVLVSVKFNNDSGANYSVRISVNGAADGTGVSLTAFDVHGAAGIAQIGELSIEDNVSNFEKVVYFRGETNSNGGATVVPDRRIGVAKWVNTVSQLTRIDLTTSTNQYAIGSEIIVLGHD